MYSQFEALYSAVSDFVNHRVAEELTLRERMRIYSVLAWRDALNLKLPLGIRPLFTGSPSTYHTSISNDCAIENHNSFGRLPCLGVHNTPADFVSFLYFDPGNIHIRGFRALFNLDRPGLRWVGRARVESFRIR